MTTGRINQVTIRHPGRTLGAPAPEGGRSLALPDGRRAPKRPQPQATRRLRQARPRATDSIIPTEFPRGWSAAPGFGHLAARPRCMHPPSGGGQRPLTPFHRRLSAVASPRRSCWRRWRSQASTDPNVCPLP